MQFVGILGTIAGNLCHAITAHGFESLAILNFSGFVFATAIESLFPVPIYFSYVHYFIFILHGFVTKLGVQLRP